MPHIISFLIERPIRPAAVCLLLLIGAGLLVSCDPSLVEPPTAHSPSDVPTRAGGLGLTADTAVTFVPMPPGADLLPLPGTSSLRARQAALPEAPPALAGSPYGCLYSTPNLQAPSTGPAYRYRRVYAFFPLAAVAGAKGAARTVVFQLNSRTLYAGGAERAAAHVVRVARCRLPDTDAAQALLHERLRRFPEPPHTHARHAQAKRTRQQAWVGVSASAFSPSGLVTPSATSKRKVCVDYEYVWVYPDGNTCYSNPVDGLVCDQPILVRGECQRYITVDGGGGGGGSPGGVGSDPSPCAQEPTTQLCDLGGGPVDPAPPEPADDPPVTKSEVVDEIRRVCANAPGVTLPGSDDMLSGYFQASVRKSLNATLSEMRRYRWDGTQQDHPQLTNLVDGYAIAVTNDGVHLPDVVSSILEVKFTENPTYNLSSSQWKAHIDDLARYYDRIPENDYNLGAPLYLLVTNSTYTSIDNLGGDESVRIPEYASVHGVNVMHLRVTKDFSGTYHLEGDLISSSDALNWIADLFKDVKIPLQVACHREN
ncbi:hypothetical protein [Salisaeta longa]|uniref:hypothetical protein n=1 Tax=Salisaeta longa TaxID=503170 RepID=UPI0003B5806C|nr:hypothetical protein [Salisaeta longa]